MRSLLDTNRWAWSALRRTILVRDGWRCQLCGAEATTVDHIVPEHAAAPMIRRTFAGAATDAKVRMRPLVARFADTPATPTRASAAHAVIRPILGELSIGVPRRGDD